MNKVLTMIMAAALVTAGVAFAADEGLLIAAADAPAGQLLPDAVNTDGVKMEKPVATPVTDVSTDGTTLFAGARIANIYSLLQHPGKWTAGEWTTSGGILAALIGIGSQTDWYGLDSGGSSEPEKVGASGSAHISPSGTTQVDFDNVTGGVALSQKRGLSGSSTTTITITQAE